MCVCVWDTKALAHNPTRQSIKQSRSKQYASNLLPMLRIEPFRFLFLFLLTRSYIYATFTHETLLFLPSPDPSLHLIRLISLFLHVEVRGGGHWLFGFYLLSKGAHLVSLWCLHSKLGWTYTAPFYVQSAPLAYIQSTLYHQPCFHSSLAEQEWSSPKVTF